MRKVTTYGYIKKGKLFISKRLQFLENISIIGGDKDNMRVKVTVEKLYNKASDEQRGYYFGYLIDELFIPAYKNASGEILSTDEAHEMLARELLSYKVEIVNEKTGETTTLTKVKSTSNFTTVEHIEYWRDVAKFLHDFFNIDTYAPNSQTELLLFNEEV